MSRLICCAALVLSLIFIFGCSQEPIKDSPHFEIDPVIEDTITTEAFNVPNPGEVDLVENMAAYRANYKESLKRLVNYYNQSGDTIKGSWAKRELQSLRSMPKYKYIMTAVIADADLKATDLINEADQLYREGMELYKEATKFVVIADEDKLRLALNKFNEVIGLYPTSDKIDDAAYMAGKIYRRFGDYVIASIYFQRTFQWNPATKTDARSKAAYILDKMLNKKDQALELYRLAYKYETNYPNNREFAKQRILALTDTDEKLDNDKMPLPEVPGKESDLDTM